MKKMLNISKSFNVFQEKLNILTCLKILMGVFALFASANISIPIKPVPITLQTVIVSLISLTSTPFVSILTILSYLSIGAFGVPMFANFGGGILYITGPSGGYLAGMLISAPIISILARDYFSSSKFSDIILCSLAGHSVIYCTGLAWLATFIGIKHAIYSGFIIYIPTGILKIIIFSYSFSYLHSK